MNDAEHREQVKLFAWAEWERIDRPELGLLFAVPNGGRRDAVTGARLKAEGVKAGVPDVWLPVARRVPWEYTELAASGAFEHTLESHAEGLEAIIFAGHVERLARCVMSPVEALHGERDGAAPVGPVREMAARYGWRLRVAPTGRHQVALARPRMTAAWVRTHLFEAVHR